MANKNLISNKRKRKGVGSMIQTHGALPEQDNSAIQLMAREISPYKQQTLAEYTDVLDEMDLMELHDHAIKMGQVPITNRNLLTDRLEREWSRSNGTVRQEVSKMSAGAYAMSPENQAIALKILRKGR